MSQDNIADASKPSPGRVYDYILGGNHNFEVDRQAADQLLKIMPFGAKFARLQRWALQDIAVELAERRGYDVIIDFASGLPTNDHIHYKVPQGTTVIYSDIDPVVVEYAHEILQNTPDVYFFQGDCCKPEDLLNRPELEKILGGRRKVGLVYWGISSLLPDEGMQHGLRYIYDWAAPGSCLAFNAQFVVNLEDPAVQQVLQVYAKMGQNVFVRSLKEYEELLKPWQLETQSFIPLLEWHGFDQSELSKEDIVALGPVGGFYGTYLIK